MEFKAHPDKLSELLLCGGCKTSVEGLENKMIKSREGLLLEGDVERDAKEVGSGKEDLEVEEGGL